MSLWEWIASDCEWCNYDLAMLGEQCRGIDINQSPSRLGMNEAGDTLGNCSTCRDIRQKRIIGHFFLGSLPTEELLDHAFNGTEHQRQTAAYWLREATQ